MLAAACRSSKERTLFVFALIFSGMVWLGLVISLVGLFYAPFVALGIVVAHAFFLARLTGNSIRVGSRQLPELYKRVEQAAQKLGIERMPEVYVTNGSGILNAFATKLFSRTFVVLNAEILDACDRLDEGKGPNDPKAVDFIIGHELGHLALGHLSWNWLLAPAKIVPLLGPAYSRACEYSADACGLAAADDAETASRALAVLAAGGQARKITVDALMEQRHDTGGFIMGIVELNATHPYLSKRVAAIQRLRDGGMAPEIGRNPFSYLFAPMFAGASSLVFMYIAVVGVVAAIAVPAAMKFDQQSKAKSAALFGDLDKGFADLDKQADTNESGLGGLKGTDDAAKDNLFGALGGGQAENDKAMADLMKALEQASKDAEGAGGLGLKGTGFGGGMQDVEDAIARETFIPPPASQEARVWLKGQQAMRNKEAIANLATVKAVAFVEKLYKTGAKKVWVNDINVDDEGIYAGEIVAEMPMKPLARKKLVDLCTAEFAKQGYDEPCEDGGVDALYFTWE